MELTARSTPACSAAAKSVRHAVLDTLSRLLDQLLTYADGQFRLIALRTLPNAGSKLVVRLKDADEQVRGMQLLSSCNPS